MRITLVSPFDAHPRHEDEVAGGVERVFGHLARELVSRGHDITLLCSTSGAPGRAKLEGVRVLREHRHGAILEAPLARLARAIPPESDLVHVAATSPPVTAGVLRRAHELGIPSVLDFHYEPDPGTTVGRLAAGVYRKWGASTYELANTVLVRSLAYGRSAPSLQSVPESQWRVVPNGVDPTLFCPGARNDGDYLLFVGRLLPYKGLDVLLHASARRPTGLPLLIAGEGPLRRHLEHLARRLGVDAHFLGHVTDEELPRLYRGARATILPSTTSQEAFGMPLLESMACGTPVVASKIPGVEEVARLGGLVAKPGDPGSLGTQILRAANSDLLLRGPKLAAAIHRDYSWSAVTDRLEAVYRELLGSPIRVQASMPPQG